MVEKKIPKINTLSDQLSNSNTLDEEADPRLHTSEEERNYGTLRGSTQATQVALSHSRVQMNPTVERGPPWKPKINYPETKQQKRALRLRIRKNKCNKHLLCIVTICMHARSFFLHLYGVVLNVSYCLCNCAKGPYFSGCA